MKANPSPSRLAASCNRILGARWFRHFLLPGLSVAVLVLNGCSTGKPAATASRAASSPDENLRFHLGTIALKSDLVPARISFQKAEGRIDEAGDRAATAAGNILATSTSDGLIDTAISPITMVLAPVVAANAALRSGKRLDAQRLAQCETNLTVAMEEMSLQRRFHDSLLKSAREKNCRIVSWDATSGAKPHPGVDSILEARVEELRLERAGKGDASFALGIKTRTRLIRAADGVVLYDRPAEYRSEPGLFVEWSLANVFEKVTDTGYRRLSRDLVDRLLQTMDRPVLLGAGYGQGPLPEAASAVRFVSHRNRNENVSAHLVQDRAETGGSIEVFSTARPASVALQTPLSREEGAFQAVRETEWILDGLPDHPNVLVSVPACVAAIPISLWKQSTAWIHGVPPEKIREAELKLREAASLVLPHQELARQVAAQLAPRTLRSVVLVDQARPLPAAPDAVRTRFVSRGTAEALLIQGGATREAERAAPEYALDIQVQRAALAGKGGVNSSLALTVEAQAVLRRTQDRQPVYSCPVHYRSAARKFTDWAAHDAKPFREELQKCYRELSAVMVNRLIERGTLPPDHRSLPILAQH